MSIAAKKHLCKRNAEIWLSLLCEARCDEEGELVVRGQAARV